MLRPKRSYAADRFLAANACFKVEGHVLVVVDSTGSVHRFPLNGKATAPARIARVIDKTGPYTYPTLDLTAWEVQDGDGKALAIAPYHAFDPMGVQSFARAARLKLERQAIENREQRRLALERRRGCVELKPATPLPVYGALVCLVALSAITALVFLTKGASVSVWLVAAWIVLLSAAGAVWQRSRAVRDP